ncbi:HET-E1 [Symbiodinium pilosum]|uniref:HET-E1 protein n=1 Tax=Symbiodinium pilosum TaxID=2952 RepID=A0A812L1I7_SYMPI|nr:HET-E1 [Symbiodinium pilosum]
MESASSRLGELEKSYSDLAQSLHRPTNVRYTVLWDLGKILHALYTCFPQGHGGSMLQSVRSLFQKPPPKPCTSTMRKELCQLRQQANRQRWICWESDAAGLEVEVAMLSGRSWKFIIGNTAKGVEVKERLAELSGIHQAELSLVCSGRQIRDDEVLLTTFFSDLAGPPPQLQLLRIFRPFALTCSTDCTLKMWDMDRAACVQTLRGHGDGVMSLVVDWKTRYAVSGAHDCTLRVWDLDHCICVQAIQVADHPAFCLDFDHASSRILTGSWDKNVKIWDSELGVCVATFSGHVGMVKVVRLDWPRRRALSGSCDGTLKVWDLDRESCLCTLEGHQDEVWSADVDWTRNTALSGSADSSVRYWNLATGDCLATLRGHTHGVAAVSLQGKEGRALSGSWDRSLRLWDLQKQECLTMLVHGTSVTTMSVDWVHGKALTGSPQAMKLWDFNRQTCEHDLAGHLCDSVEVSGSSTPVSVGHNECVTSLVMNSPDYFCSQADE